MPAKTWTVKLPPEGATATTLVRAEHVFGDPVPFRTAITGSPTVLAGVTFVVEEVTRLRKVRAAAQRSISGRIQSSAATTPHVNHRTWHVRISALVAADAVELREPQDLR